MAFKPLFAAATLAAATVFTAIPAMAQRVDFRGFGYLFDFSDSCLEYDWSGIRPVTVRYRPAGVGDNGSATQLAFFDEFFALGYRQPNGFWTAAGARWIRGQSLPRPLPIRTTCKSA